VTDTDGLLLPWLLTVGLAASVTVRVAPGDGEVHAANANTPAAATSTGTTRTDRFNAVTPTRIRPAETLPRVEEQCRTQPERTGTDHQPT
jgi:hypothetical protein